jgi:hypothetical protein
MTEIKLSVSSSKGINGRRTLSRHFRRRTERNHSVDISGRKERGLSMDIFEMMERELSVNSSKTKRQGEHSIDIFEIAEIRHSVDISEYGGERSFHRFF